MSFFNWGSNGGRKKESNGSLSENSTSSAFPTDVSQAERQSQSQSQSQLLLTSPSQSQPQPQLLPQSGTRGIVLPRQNVYRSNDGSLQISRERSDMPSSLLSSRAHRQPSSMSELRNDSLHPVTSHATTASSTGSQSQSQTQSLSRRLQLHPSQDNTNIASTVTSNTSSAPSNDARGGFFRNLSYYIIPPSSSQAQRAMSTTTATESSVDTSMNSTPLSGASLQPQPQSQPQPQLQSQLQSPTHPATNTNLPNNTQNSTPASGDDNTGLFAGFNPLTGSISLGASVATVSTLSLSNLISGAQDQLSSAAAYVSSLPIVSSMPSLPSVSSLSPFPALSHAGEAIGSSFSGIGSSFAHAGSSFYAFLLPYLEFEYWRSMLHFFFTGQWLSWDNLSTALDQSVQAMQSFYSTIYGTGEVVALRASEFVWSAAGGLAAVATTNPYTVGLAAALLTASVSYGVYRYYTRSGSQPGSSSEPTRPGFMHSTSSGSGSMATTTLGSSPASLAASTGRARNHIPSTISTSNGISTTSESSAATGSSGVGSSETIPSGSELTDGSLDVFELCLELEDLMSLRDLNFAQFEVDNPPDPNVFRDGQFLTIEAQQAYEMSREEYISWVLNRIDALQRLFGVDGDSLFGSDMLLNDHSIALALDDGGIGDGEEEKETNTENTIEPNTHNYSRNYTSTLNASEHEKYETENNSEEGEDVDVAPMTTPRGTPRRHNAGRTQSHSLSHSTTISSTVPNDTTATDFENSSRFMDLSIPRELSRTSPSTSLPTNTDISTSVPLATISARQEVEDISREHDNAMQAAWSHLAGRADISPAAVAALFRSAHTGWNNVEAASLRFHTVQDRNHLSSQGGSGPTIWEESQDYSGSDDTNRDGEENSEFEDDQSDGEQDHPHSRTRRQEFHDSTIVSSSTSISTSARALRMMRDGDIEFTSETDIDIEFHNISRGRSSFRTSISDNGDNDDGVNSIHSSAFTHVVPLPLPFSLPSVVVTANLADVTSSTSAPVPTSISTRIPSSPSVFNSTSIVASVSTARELGTNNTVGTTVSFSTNGEEYNDELNNSTSTYPRVTIPTIPTITAVNTHPGTTVEAISLESRQERVRRLLMSGVGTVSLSQTVGAVGAVSIVGAGIAAASLFTGQTTAATTILQQTAETVNSAVTDATTVTSTATVVDAITDTIADTVTDTIADTVITVSTPEVTRVLTAMLTLLVFAMFIYKLRMSRMNITGNSRDTQQSWEITRRNTSTVANESTITPATTTLTPSRIAFNRVYNFRPLGIQAYLSRLRASFPSMEVSSMFGDPILVPSDSMNSPTDPDDGDEEIEEDSYLRADPRTVANTRKNRGKSSINFTDKNNKAVGGDDDKDDKDKNGNLSEDKRVSRSRHALLHSTRLSSSSSSSSSFAPASVSAFSVDSIPTSISASASSSSNPPLTSKNSIALRENEGKKSDEEEHSDEDTASTYSSISVNKRHGVAALSRSHVTIDSNNRTARIRSHGMKGHPDTALATASGLVSVLPSQDSSDDPIDSEISRGSHSSHSSYNSRNGLSQANPTSSSNSTSSPIKKSQKDSKPEIALTTTKPSLLLSTPNANLNPSTSFDEVLPYTPESLRKARMSTQYLLDRATATGGAGNTTGNGLGAEFGSTRHFGYLGHSGHSGHSGHFGHRRNMDVMNRNNHKNNQTTFGVFHNYDNSITQGQGSYTNTSNTSNTSNMTGVTGITNSVSALRREDFPISSVSDTPNTSNPSFYPQSGVYSPSYESDFGGPGSDHYTNMHSSSPNSGVSRQTSAQSVSPNNNHAVTAAGMNNMSRNNHQYHQPQHMHSQSSLRGSQRNVTSNSHNSNNFNNSSGGNNSALGVHGLTGFDNINRGNNGIHSIHDNNDNYAPTHYDNNNPGLYPSRFGFHDGSSQGVGVSPLAYNSPSQTGLESSLMYNQNNSASYLFHYPPRDPNHPIPQSQARIQTQTQIQSQDHTQSSSQQRVGAFTQQQPYPPHRFSQSSPNSRRH